MPFDVQAAKKAGYSEVEIADHLASQSRFDAASARKSGYSDAEIIGHLAGAKPKAKPSAVGTVKDVGRQYLSGLSEGVAGLSDMVMQASPVGMVSNMFRNAANLADLTRQPTLSDLVTGNAPGRSVNVTAAPVNAQQAAATRAAPQAQTRAGRYARTVGQMTPNAGVPASAVARAANVFAPAVASEAAGEVANHFGAGPTGEMVARTAGAALGGVAASMRRGALPAQPEPQSAAQEAMSEVGIDIQVLPERTRARAVQLIEDGRTPEEVATFVAASEGVPVPIPLRRGDMTRNPVHQHAENMALRGAYGERPAAIMQGQVARQQEALRGNVNVFASELAGGSPRPVGQGATPAAERLAQMREEAEQGVSAAYRTAREGDAGSRLPRDQGPILAQRLREGVEEFDMEGVPRVARELARFDNRGGPVDVRDLFSARARLNKLTQSADPVEASAAASAKRSLDGYVDEALDAGLIQGDAASVGQWRDAIGQRRRVAETFESNDLIDTLTERTFRNGDRRALKVDPGEAANAIFGRANNFAGKKDLHRDLSRLRDVLGPQSGEWNSIRGEAFQRIARAGEGGIEGGERQFSGVKFQKAWQDFLRDDPRLANSLFTAEERGRISNFATIASRVTSPVKGGDNPSNSAVSALKLLPAFLRNLPFLREAANGINVQVKVNSTVRSVNPYPSRAPRPRRAAPSANPFAAALPAGLVSGAGEP